MQSTLTLSNIYESDVSKVGYRAVYLAKISQKSYPVPLSFVIPCEMFDAFVEQSGIKTRLKSIYRSFPSDELGYARAHDEIKKLFKQISFSSEIKEELTEAYESIAIPSEDANASDLVKGVKDPAVTLFSSPTYIESRSELDSTLVRVEGREDFFEAIKMIWSDMFNPKAVIDRKANNIEEFSLGIIVQQQLPFDVCAHGVYHGELENQIKIRAYKGLLDTRDELPKDEFELSAEHLEVKRSIIRQQPFRIIAGEGSTTEKEGLGNDSDEQKLSDRMVLELGRLTKRVHVVLELDVSIHLGVVGEKAFILLATSSKEANPSKDLEDKSEGIIDQPEIVVEDSDKIKIGLDAEPEEESSQEAPEATNMNAEEPTMEIEAADDEEIPKEDLETFEEITAEEHPIEIVDEQDSPSISTYGEENTIIEEDKGEPQNPSKYQEQENGEETLFDLFEKREDGQLEDNKSLAFVREVASTFRKHLFNEFRNTFGEQELSDELVLRELDDKAILVSRESARKLLFDEKNLQGDDVPGDELIGIAWRVKQFFSDR